MRLLINSTNVAEINNLRVLGEPKDGATVTVTVYDRNNNPVPGEAWPVQLINIAPAQYRGTLGAGLVLERGRPYRAVFTASLANTTEKSWEVECVAQADKVF